MTKGMKTVKTPHSAPEKANPTILCPACGASIPIAEAVAIAMAEHSAESERAALLWRQQEVKLKTELAEAVNHREVELTKAHEEEIARLSQDAEKRVQLGIAMRIRLIEFDKRRTEKRLKELQEQLDKAEQVAESAFREGRTIVKAEAKKAERALSDAVKESARLKQKLAETEVRLGTAHFDQQAAFEKGRSAAILTSQKQLGELQNSLDVVRASALKREAELDAKLAEGIREAETRGQARMVREKHAAVVEALQAERARLLADVSKERAVERQRFEVQATRMKAEIDSLHQRAEVGMSEATGQAAEDVLEKELRDAFQSEGDIVTRARKGQKYADLSLTVCRGGSRKLLIECKWTQAWDSGWVAKAREDRANAGAEVVIIVTRTLPIGVEHLGQIGEVWVASPKTALILITALRQGLVAVERAQRASGMDEVRIRELKSYISGPQFRDQVEEVVTLAQNLMDSQVRERTQHERSWKEAKVSFERILSSALGIWTDLEIASGQSLQASEVVEPYLRVQGETRKPKNRPKAA